ncbi:ArsR family transcriptional regulator [Methanomicrobium antiquum]|uniref:ArsR family transcriptional regulator n=1 Tax=Methanomicrobium antiquum TaxID=487686 RepID=A0AAF0FP27_9EURY|nr:helix-turn-helix domain-containing protein [Methanomicrobium antiquum]MDD3976923.1 helix-turn-helix domain-containing protein [Methanomicrobium sp.]WFN37833.1 ArsR family transcriptional regulator [Methanomicrobium antiquum]
MSTVNSVNKIRLPPSAKVVLSILEDGKAKTFKDMTDEAEIAPRTIRYALKRLKESGLIIEKFNFRDARQVLYQKNTITKSDKTPEMAST